jgi:hypothetical protein
MAIDDRLTIRCDTDGCDRFIQTTQTDPENARHEALRAGWNFDEGDHCSEHA